MSQIAGKTDQPEEPPAEGTLKWLALREHVEIEGLLVPDVHRIAAGSTLVPLEEAGKHCRVVRPNGERCGAPATRSYGLCISHVGGGGQDYSELARRGHAGKARLKMQRQLLGIGPSRVGSPRQRARLAAAARADEIAQALVDDVLDAELEPLVRQAAALRILDATYPLQTATLEVEVPASEGEVGSMGWAEMQQLAATLLSEE